MLKLSLQIFRSQPAHLAHDQDAARFFSAHGAPAPQFAAPPAFDLSSMRAALPLNGAAQGTQAPAAAWAADFLQSQPGQAAPMMEQQHAQMMGIDAQMDTPLQQQQAQPGRWSSFAGASAELNGLTQVPCSTTTLRCLISA